ncbi:MAG: hypothetical protein V3V95_02205 [Thermodesulfobacteriota bacterium]
MLKKLSPSILIVLLLGLLLGASIGCSSNPEELDAERFLNNYFKYLKNQDFNTIHSMYAKSAFGVVSSTKALRGMKKTMRSFGPLQSYEFDRGSTYVKNDQGAILSLKLSYDVIYKNMRTREGFIVTKKNQGPWRITTHTIERL